MTRRDLAANIGIPFYTPEEYFLGAEAELFTRDFEPKDFLKIPLDGTEPAYPDVGFKRVNLQDIILHCGSPGAGKSTFFWKKLEPLGYCRINQDILKTVSTRPNVS
jgi:bifunctional polynucleotide phosphatase/kinase